MAAVPATGLLCGFIIMFIIMDIIIKVSRGFRVFVFVCIPVVLVVMVMCVCMYSCTICLFRYEMRRVIACMSVGVYT